ncbi:protein kinase [Streptomyces sp. NPDC051940]|uniref:protein kinase domain-containing protein n=1 Tax=Streptomyces sp. NPDC051940 TaxID=3155675 RepID=UPI00342BBBAD
MADGGRELPGIPGYRLERELGRGGMGRVYLGRSASGRQVAVKVIRQDVAHQPEFRRRFRQEVTAARGVSGAFTAPVLDADPDADPPWMATLYIPGEPLDDRIRRGPAFTDDELLRLATGLVEALRDIHRAGIVHRDLKPGNVLLAEDGPRVIDFGVVRAMDAGAELTQTGIAVGTPPFMSPEQIRAQRDIGPPSDVFSLGSVLTFAASGHVPFDATDVYAVAYQLVHEEPDLGGVPPWLLPVVRECLAKDPADRPTPDGLLARLQALHPAPGAPVPDPGPHPPTVVTGVRQPPAPQPSAFPTAPSVAAGVTQPAPQPADTPRRGRRRMAAAVAGVVAVAVLTSGALYTLLDGNGDDPTTGSTTGGGTSDPGKAQDSPKPAKQPPGAADYLPADSGTGGYSFSYRDTPDRRPKGFTPWSYKAVDADCVLAGASLFCADDQGTHRIDAATGKRRWLAPTGVAFRMAPAVVGDAVVVNTGDEWRAFAVSDGQPLWSYPVTTGPLVSDGRNVYGSRMNGEVHAVGAESGERVWKKGPATASTSDFTPAVRVLDGTVYVFTGTEDMELTATAFDAGSGKRLRTVELEQPCVMGTEALVEESGKPVVYCAQSDVDGMRLFRQELRVGGASKAIPVEGMWGSGQVAYPDLSAAAGRVYLVTDVDVVAVDTGSGRELWRKPMPGTGMNDAPPVWAGGRLYVVSTTTAAAFDPESGNVLWQDEVPAEGVDQETLDMGLPVEPVVAGGVLFTPSAARGWVSFDTVG